MNMRVAVGAIWLAGLFAGLALATWRRSGDAIVDFPRQAYTAWRLAEGDLLYRDVSCVYGPWPHMVETIGFQIFGPGLDVIFALNLAVAALCTGLYFACLSAGSDRVAALAGTSAFLVISVFSQAGPLSHFTNYNFVTPYCSQVTWGFLGLLLIIWGLPHLSPKRLGVAGAGFALALLNKPEFVLAGAACWIVAIAVWLAGRPWSQGWAAAKDGLTLMSATAAGFGAIMGLTFGWFALRGGWLHGWEAISAVPVSVLAPEGRFPAGDTFFNTRLLGTKFFAINAALSLLAGGVLFLAGWFMFWAGNGLLLCKRARWAMGLIVFSTGALMAGSSALGKALVLPVFVLAACSVWKCLRQGVQRSTTSVAVALLATAGAFMLVRQILNVKILHYGFFITPLALGALFLWGYRLGGAARVAALAALMGLSAGAMWQTGHSWIARTLPLGTGRDRFFAIPNLNTSQYLRFGLEAVGGLKRKPRSLLGLPESAAFNYHTRIPSTIKAQEFNPDHLLFQGETKLLLELSADPPEAVILHNRDFSEYGVRHFGYDRGSGLEILRWVLRKYRPAASLAWDPARPADGGVVLLVLPQLLSGPDSEPQSQTTPTAPGAP